MKNFLHTDEKYGKLKLQNLTFDLKGATTNRRRFSNSELDKIRKGDRGSSLLDWDWMDLGYRLRVQPDVAKLVSTLYGQLL